MDSDIEVEVQFLSAMNSGREQLPNLKEGTYRPHFHVALNDVMLGIQFVTGPSTIQANVPFRATVQLLYVVDYSALVVGTHFDIVEGPRVVGSGIVIGK